MDAKELKLLLRLLGYNHYKAAYSDKLKPTDKTPMSELKTLCYKLRDRGYIDFNEAITHLIIEPSGKEILKLDASTLIVTADELKVLKASAKGQIPPGKTNIPAERRQAVIQNLAERGFIKVVKKKITEVWITSQGQEHLCQEYTSNSTATITLKMLTDYLRFMRKSFADHSSSPVSSVPLKDSSEQEVIQKPDDESILELIRNLDRELQTDNYLPIFHLRERLQPPLTREELDQCLFRLQRQEYIELSSLQESMSYTIDQINAGIDQGLGRRLFFIIVNS